MNYAPVNQGMIVPAAGNTQTTDCIPGGAVALERVRYFNRQLLTAEDMTTEQNYFLQKLRRHNQFLHGWGVVCGLGVTPSPIADLPWQVQIDAGYALGPYGDEIFVGEPFLVDLAKCGPNAATDPCEPSLITGGSGINTGKRGVSVYIAIKYAECLARPVVAMPPGCGCGDDVCEFSRIADSFEVQCLAQSPDILKSVIVTLCDIVEHGAIAPCPPCSDNPWVVLARVDLPAAPSTAIAASNIDNTERRIVLSTTVLQEQLIACCCDTKSNSTVDLQSILVRRNGTTDPFQSSATLEAAHAPWDYQLTLTGQTPVDLPITITASNTTYVPNLTSPVTVPAGQSSLVVLNVPALLVVGKPATVKITALGKVNTSVATLNIPAGQIE